MKRRKRSDLEIGSRKRIIDHAVKLGFPGVAVYVRRVTDAPEPWYRAGLTSSGDTVCEGRPALTEGRACEFLLTDVLRCVALEDCIR